MSYTRPTKAPMSDAQKKAMAEGRTLSRAIARYLEALDATAPKRGGTRSQKAIEQRLREIETELPAATPITKLTLIQERLDLHGELEAMQGAPDLAAYEKDFVAVAKEYGERKGITYSAWRAYGVDPAVLKRAGITR